MSNYTKGGRGKKAPYETTHRRIPTRLKPIVEKLIAKFRVLIDDPEKFDEVETKLNEILVNDEVENKDDTKLNACELSKEETIEMAKKLLRAKRSKKETVEKLVSSIYGGDIDLNI